MGERSAPTGVLTLAPADASVALYVPHLETFTQDALSFVTTIEAKAATDALSRVRRALSTELGIDPLAPETLEKVGLRPGGEALIYVPHREDSPILMLPVARPADFDRSVRMLVEKLDGANRHELQTVGHSQLHIVGRPFGDAVVPVVAWAHHHGYAHMAAAQGIDPLRRRLASKDSQPAQGAALSTQWRPAASKPEHRLWAALRTPTASATLTLGAGGLTVEAWLPLGDPTLPAVLKAPAPSALARQLGDDALLFALTHAVRPEVWDTVRADASIAAFAGRALVPLTRATGLDLERQVLPLLAGPLSAAVYLGDAAMLAPMLRRGVRSARLSLDLIQVAIVARVRDADGMLTLLRRSQQLLAAKHIAIDEHRETLGGVTAHIFAPGKLDRARLGWALWGDTYVYGAGTGRLRATLSRLATPVDDSTGVSAPILRSRTIAAWMDEPDTSVLVFRAAELGGRLRALLGGSDATADPALGGTIDAALRLFEAVGDIGVRIDAHPDGLRLRLRQELS